jgi:serine/threonine-protein kinase LATS1/2
MATDVYRSYAMPDAALPFGGPEPSAGEARPPPPPYPSSQVRCLDQTGEQLLVNGTPVAAKQGTVINTARVIVSTAAATSVSRSDSPTSVDSGASGTDSAPDSSSSRVAATTHHTSPRPARKQLSPEKEETRRESLIRNIPPHAYKFFMEQHVENVLRYYDSRRTRRHNLEAELVKCNITDPHAMEDFRALLCRKETEHLRLKRAKLNRTHFTVIRKIGSGAFGEVSLVRYGQKHYYAMKTLKKRKVVRSKQVAHVIAERDILSEADNEWIVKLQYSFQVRCTSTRKLSL